MKDKTGKKFTYTHTAKQVARARRLVLNDPRSLRQIERDEGFSDGDIRYLVSGKRYSSVVVQRVLTELGG